MPYDQADMDLLSASTTFTIKNGRMMLFWHDNWSDKGPLKVLAPELFKIATRKNRTVNVELSGENWIRAGAKLHTLAQLGEFGSLWEWINRTQLMPNHEDTISWNLTTNGLLLSFCVCGSIAWISP